MKKYAVIVAGGMGTRMGATVPKQFMLIAGKPVLYYTIAAFLNTYNDIQIVLVLPEGYINDGEKIAQEYFSDAAIRIVVGGETRFHSVKNGLKEMKEEGIVFVHDAVRCCLTGSLIKRCYESAEAKGTAIPVMKVKDSVRMISDGGTQPIDRNKLLLVQTPQTFRSDILLSAFEQEYNEAFTDEATVVEQAGGNLFFVAGEESNIKITTPIDVEIAGSYLLSFK